MGTEADSRAEVIEGRRCERLREREWVLEWDDREWEWDAALEREGVE